MTQVLVSVILSDLFDLKAFIATQRAGTLLLREGVRVAWTIESTAASVGYRITFNFEFEGQCAFLRKNIVQNFLINVLEDAELAELAAQNAVTGFHSADGCR